MVLKPSPGAWKEDWVGGQPQGLGWGLANHARGRGLWPGRTGANYICGRVCVHTNVVHMCAICTSTVCIYMCANCILACVCTHVGSMSPAQSLFFYVTEAVCCHFLHDRVRPPPSEQNQQPIGGRARTGTTTSWPTSVLLLQSSNFLRTCSHHALLHGALTMT